MTGRLGYRPALDGLRGLAVSAVVVFHVRPGLLPGGFTGVDVFFVLSGFLITSLLIEELDGRGRVDLGAFYARRGLRLLPALWAVIAVTVLLAAVGVPMIGGLDETRGDVLPALLWFDNLHEMTGRPHAMLSHTWSLATEEQFYLLWPPVLLLCLRRSPTLALVAALTAVAGVTGVRLHLLENGYSQYQLYWFPRFSGLFAGCALALAVHRGLRVPPWLAWPGALVVLGSFGVSTPELADSVASVGAVLLVGAVAGARTSVPATVAALRLPVHVGRISYGVYLWNPAVVAVSLWAFGRDDAAAQVVSVGGTWLVAALSFHCFERPIQRRGRAWLERRGPVQPVVPQPRVTTPGPAPGVVAPAAADAAVPVGRR